MAPDGVPPFVTNPQDFESDTDLESVTRIIFAQFNTCATADVDNLLDHPDLEQQFDDVMDRLAADPLEDSVEWVGVDVTHLTAPVRVFDVTGEVIDHKFIPIVVEAHLFCYAPEKGE